VVSGVVAVAFALFPAPYGHRIGPAIVIALLCATVLFFRWREPLARFDYRERQGAGQVRCTYVPIPFSPLQSDPSRYLKPPGSPSTEDGPCYLLGTDPVGQDVLSQLIHACRLSISIGLVSTGIALAIGITIGALAGYLGGSVDLLLQRVIEIFMAVPVLFLLVVVAGILPAHLRTTHVLMAVIGCVTWTGAARLHPCRVSQAPQPGLHQAARAAGLPLSSILFRHMLPNGITPVLVDASFAIAGAILAESTLSYLGLGPIDQPSWGKLLSGAAGSSGQFVWWLAIFPAWQSS
jgi:peptide/nickel transport system permease protein